MTPSIFVYAFLLAMCIVAVKACYNYAVKISGKKPWLLQIAFIISGMLGILFAICALDPLLGIFIKIVASSGKINPAVPAIILAITFGLCLIISRKLFYVLIQTIFSWEKPEAWTAKALWLGWVIFALHVLGIASGFGEMAFVTTNLFVFGLLAFATWSLISKWQSNHQNRFALPATYLLDMVLTGLICWFFGFFSVPSVIGSVFFLLPFLAFNLLVFWLSYVVGRPAKDMKNRFAYWILLPWTLLLAGLTLGIVILMFTNQITPEELTALRTVNIYSSRLGKMQREMALYGRKDAEEEAKKALAEDDIEALKAAVEKLETINQKVRAVEPGIPKLPRAIDEILGRSPSAFDRKVKERAEELLKQNGYVKCRENGEGIWQDVPGSVEIIDDPLLYTTEGAPITFPLAKVGHQAGFTGEHFEIKMYDPKTNKYIWWPCNNENFAKVIGDGIKKYPTYVRSITGKPVTKKLRVFK